MNGTPQVEDRRVTLSTEADALMHPSPAQD
jgi:hypothetical protein